MRVTARLMISHIEPFSHMRLSKPAGYACKSLNAHHHQTTPSPNITAAKRYSPSPAPSPSPSPPYRSHRRICLSIHLRQQNITPTSSIKIQAELTLDHVFLMRQTIPRSVRLIHSFLMIPLPARLLLRARPRVPARLVASDLACCCTASTGSRARGFHAVADVAEWALAVTVSLCGCLHVGWKRGGVALLGGGRGGDGGVAGRVLLRGWGCDAVVGKRRGGGGGVRGHLAVAFEVGGHCLEV